jgi:hypothetical protein
MNVLNNKLNLTMRSKCQHGLLILNVRTIHSIFLSWRHKWYDPGKIKFGFWRKKYTYLVLRKYS